MVSLSSSVTTPKKRSRSSGTEAQNRKRLCSCGSERTGAWTTRMHFLREVRPLRQNLVLEVRSKLEVRHSSEHTVGASQGKREAANW